MSAKHKFSFSGVVRDIAICGVAKVQWRLTAVSTGMYRRWRGVTCKRCLAKRQHGPHGEGDKRG